MRGAALDPADKVRGEWDVTVVAPHFSAALLARDLGDTGPERDRMFEYALTYDRDTVVRATNALLTRVVPRLPASLSEVGPRRAPRTVPRAVPALPMGTMGSEALLHKALSATTSGVTIAAVDRPDQPLVYVNGGFERLSGYRSEELLGGNCRFLQGADTDPAAVDRIRAAVAAGEECRETLLNYRGPDRRVWWNEIFLAPVVDGDGVVRQYIGVQNDVTARVEAERALQHERDRAQSYLARIEQFAYTDPLTGLANRRRVEERLEVALWDARADGTAVALLFLDLDGFKGVNDRYGHAAGDDLLVGTARRLRTSLRRADLLARLGGDEFLVALPHLDAETAREEATLVAAKLSAAVREPVLLAGDQVQIGVSVGVSVFPKDGDTFGALLHAADIRMYARKHPRVPHAVAE